MTRSNDGNGYYLCEDCGSGDVKVIDCRASTTHGATIRRRRECNSCKWRWTTYEVSEKVLALNNKSIHQKCARIALKAFNECRVKIEKLENS